MKSRFHVGTMFEVQSKGEAQPLIMHVPDQAMLSGVIPSPHYMSGLQPSDF